MTGPLVVAETHPIQYHAPLYRALQQAHGIPVTAVYGTDVSLHQYHDREFGTTVSWDVDLLGGYTSRFLASVTAGGPTDPARAEGSGVGAVLDAVRPAAVLIVGYSPSFHRRAWAAAWRRGIPVLFRGEATDLNQTAHGPVAFGRDMALRAAYRRCRRVLYIGERARRHYRNHGVEEERLVFSPYCVDTSPFRCTEEDRQVLRPAARRELDIDADRLVVVFSGKLSARKGSDLILPAVRLLPEALRARIVVIVLGDGALRADVLRAAADPPRVRLEVLGVQPQAALSRWYHAADLLVLPSRHGETWGLVVNEALHHGLPVVASDQVGCAPDLVTPQTGTVCEAGSAESLAAAMARVMARAGRSDVRDACRSRVRGYSVERAARGLASAFHAVSADEVVA